MLLSLFWTYPVGGGPLTLSHRGKTSGQWCSAGATAEWTRDRLKHLALLLSYPFFHLPPNHFLHFSVTFLSFFTFLPFSVNSLLLVPISQDSIHYFSSDTWNNCLLHEELLGVKDEWLFSLYFKTVGKCVSRAHSKVCQSFIIQSKWSYTCLNSFSWGLSEMSTSSEIPGILIYGNNNIHSSVRYLHDRSMCSWNLCCYNTS